MAVTPVRWRLTNPATGFNYDFSINPSDEEAFGKSRSIEHGANTADTGFVRQQSDDGPLVGRVRGTILRAEQLWTMIQFYKLCSTQTVFLRDHEGDEYEIIITDFQPTRHRTVRNPKDFSNAPYWYWKYELSFEVIRVRSGRWVGVP